MKEKFVFPGFKAFNSEMENMYGMKFEEGREYTAEGKLHFRDIGKGCNGFHMCTNLEDCFRYIGDKNDYKIAAVTGYADDENDYAEGEDDYNGIYELYAVRKIKIEHILSEKKLLSMVWLFRVSENNILYVGYRLN